MENSNEHRELDDEEFADFIVFSMLDRSKVFDDGVSAG